LRILRKSQNSDNIDSFDILIHQSKIISLQ
jgi:hypothetical protein